MKTISAAADYYRNKLIALSELKDKATQKRTILAWTRLGTILLVFAFGYIAWALADALWLIPLVGALAAFGRAIIWDVNNNAWIRRLEGLQKLITEERDFLLEGKPIPGNSQTTNEPIHEHPYAFDLDILGKGSLFAMLNRSPSEPGRQLLTNWLLNAGNRETILGRQTAAKELAKNPDALFDLAAIGGETLLRTQTVTRIQHWLDEPDTPFSQKYWDIVRWGYPVFTLALLGCYSAGLIPSSVFGLCFLAFLVISSSFSRRVGKHYSALSGIVKEVSALSESIGLIEKQDFQAPLNVQLQGALLGTGKASVQIKRLNQLLNRFDYRLNAFIFIPLNAFTLWDLQQMKGLNKWKEKNKNGVGQWVDTLAHMEALGSLALLHFNRPEWCFPDIAPEHFVFEAEDLGHPLIPASKRVTNSFSTKGSGQLELVTGSNMAGKSTFLRTIGVNMVLSMAGGPVCAASCRVSPVSVVSSMRIADNLEDSTSTFYAELKKLRSIIDKVKRHEHVFILLDEILRGTNSRDRLAGSKALVYQLVRDEAVGVIATHDLELAQLEEALPGHIHNYYFDVQFYGDELGFDYKLRNGVCTTKNAELLMKQIGIEIP